MVIFNSFLSGRGSSYIALLKLLKNLQEEQFPDTRKHVMINYNFTFRNQGQ